MIQEHALNFGECAMGAAMIHVLQKFTLADLVFRWCSVLGFFNEPLSEMASHYGN